MGSEWKTQVPKPCSTQLLLSGHMWSVGPQVALRQSLHGPYPVPTCQPPLVLRHLSSRISKSSHCPPNQSQTLGGLLPWSFGLVSAASDHCYLGNFGLLHEGLSRALELGIVVKKASTAIREELGSNPSTPACWLCGFGQVT